MNKPRNIFIAFGEWMEQREAYRSSVRQDPQKSQTTRWLPSPGSVVFTLLMIGLLLWAQTAGALPLPGYLSAPDAPSTGTIAYQGRLADANGNPLTSTVNMEFRLYNAATGGTPLWGELWTGSNAVQVSDGLFNVMLGSLTPIPQAIVTGNSSLWLGITAGTDDEMMPRVQLGSVPFAVQAQTVPDGSVTTEKIADGAVTQAKIGSGLSYSELHLLDTPVTVLESGSWVSTTGQWTLLDLSTWIPADSKAVILTILLDVDRENATEFRLGFRKPGTSAENWNALAVDGHYTPGHGTWTHNQGIVGVDAARVEWITAYQGSATLGRYLVSLVGYYR